MEHASSQQQLKISPLLRRRSQTKNKSGQSIVETMVTFIVIILFFCGIFSIWIWGMKQLVERQIAYNSTRVEAGTSSDRYTLQWPPQRAEHLTEEEVILISP